MQNLRGCGLKERNTRFFLYSFFILSIGVFLFWLYLFSKDINGSQRAVFYGEAHDWFMDWFNVVYYSVGKRPYTWGLTEERSLPPLTFLLLYPFSKLYEYDITGWAENESRYEARYSQLPIDMFTLVFILSYLLLFYSLYKHSRRNAPIWTTDITRAVLFGLLFISGVNLFCIDRGNLQVITAAAVFLYIYLCDTETTAYAGSGAAHGDEEKIGSQNAGLLRTGIGICCLAFAAAIKLFPAVMGVLLLYRKKWKEAVAAFITGMAMFLLPFLWIDQPFFEAIGSFIKTAGEHAGSYLTIAEFGLSTPMVIGFTGLSHGVLQGLAYIMAVLALITAWSLKSYWKRIMLVTLVLVMTSGQQGYYCLMFLFLPIVLFFNEEHDLKDIVYVLCFVVILSPLQRTVFVNDVRVTMRDVINIVLIGLYIELLIEAIRCTMLVRKDHA